MDEVNKMNKLFREDERLKCVVCRRVPNAGAGRRGETTRSPVREIILQLCGTEGVA